VGPAEVRCLYVGWTLADRPGIRESESQRVRESENQPYAPRAERLLDDVAEFMLKQLTEDTYLRQTPGISYRSAA